MSGITVYIICGNFEKDIARCLKSVLWAENILIVFANSTDKSEIIARQIAPKSIILKTFDEYNKNFTKWRNLGLKHINTSWLFYLDTDEMISPSLKEEIIAIINQPKTFEAYVIPRKNYFLGKHVKYGGSYPDYVKRLFYYPSFKGFSGSIHEEPVGHYSFGYLKNDILHFTHKDLNSMLEKSIAWTESQANLLFHHHHPPILSWRIYRMMVSKFIQRFFVQKMFLDGKIGFISSIFESFDTYMIYSKLYEMQKH